jgi:hypothetical protein
VRFHCLGVTDTENAKRGLCSIKTKRRLDGPEDGQIILGPDFDPHLANP